MHLLTSLLVLLVTSRLFGELFKRMGQPSMIGEIFAGILFGPALLNLIAPTQALSGIAELSVFLIVLAAGMEMEFDAVINAFRGKGLWVSLLSFSIPFFSGMFLGTFFFQSPTIAIFLGLCMSITALPVTVKILENFQLLKHPIGNYSIAAAILNDVAALLFLGVILDQPVADASRQVYITDILISTLKTSAKLSGFALFVYGTSRLLKFGGSKTQVIELFIRKTMYIFGQEALFGIAILFVLLFGSISETLGSHFVIGTFFGGLLLSSDVIGNKLFQNLKNTLESIGGGFLSPIFFTYLGLHFTVDTLTKPILFLSVFLVAIISKVVAGYLGGKLAGLSHQESMGLGSILNGRGIMELVVANIALQRGFIGKELFSTLVLMGILTTMVTPILLKKYYKKMNPYLPTT